MQGTVTITRGDAVVVHTYTAPEAGMLVTTQIIELADQLVLVDAQYQIPFAREAAGYARDLGKPISRLYVSHTHPDHFFGAAEFGKGFDIFALAEVKETIERNGTQQIADGRSALGDLVPERPTVPTRAVEPGEEVIGGVRFEFRRIEHAESESSLTVGLPDEDILITQDLLFNNVHVWIAEKHFDHWSSVIESYRQLPYDRLLPGHGRPGGRELYDRVLEYLAFAGPQLEKATNGEQLKTTLVNRFPNYGGVMLIDLENALYLFPAWENQSAAP